MNDAITLEKNKVSVKEVGYLFIKRLFDIICGLIRLYTYITDCYCSEDSICV